MVMCLHFLFFSCFKKESGCSYQKDNTVAPLSEQQALKSYLDSAGITATLDPNGFYYQIVSKGSGSVPGVCSQITVTYKGTLTNGFVFNQQTDALFTLGGLIPGWKQGLPLISSGGEIRLFIPPSLGFAGVPQTDSNNNVLVPPYSIVIFDINLINVQ